MTQRDPSAFLYLVLLFVLAAILAATGPSSASRSAAPPATSTPGIAPEDLLGTWSGTWNDTVYSVGGSLSFTITEEITGYLATGEIGLESLGLGAQGGTATGSVVADQLAFSFDAAMVGDGAGSIGIATGIAAGTGTVTAPLNFGDFVFTGSVVGENINGGFQFVSPSGGSGVASLTRTGTPVSTRPWSAVKDSYRSP